VVVYGEPFLDRLVFSVDNSGPHFKFAVQIFLHLLCQIELKPFWIISGCETYWQRSILFSIILNHFMPLPRSRRALHGNYVSVIEDTLNQI